jgi:hypothetical protein
MKFDKAPRYIVTHTMPDWDAITAAWLAQRWIAPNAPVRFVPAGETDPAATVVVDTGKVFDENAYRFDHHGERGLPCAAKLVFDFIAPNGAHLHEWVQWVERIDRGGKTIADIAGMYGALESIRVRAAAQETDPVRRDERIYAEAVGLLELIDLALQERFNAEQGFLATAACTANDVHAVLLINGSRAITDVAKQYGYKLVMFYNQHPDGTITIGVQNSDTACPLTRVLSPEHLLACGFIGELLYKEVATWYVHPDGWLAVEGSAKATPRREPLRVPIHDLFFAFCEVVRHYHRDLPF